MKKHYKLNVGKLTRSVLILMIVVLVAILYSDFVKFPETYITTWKYQLQNDIHSGQEGAIEYYENTYVANGRNLFK